MVDEDWAIPYMGMLENIKSTLKERTIDCDSMELDKLRKVVELINYTHSVEQFIRMNEGPPMMGDYPD